MVATVRMEMMSGDCTDPAASGRSAGPAGRVRGGSAQTAAGLDGCTRVGAVGFPAGIRGSLLREDELRCSNPVNRCDASMQIAKK